MSRELLFYPALKTKETKEYIPLLYDIDKSPTYIFWRSGSFIDMDFFINELEMVQKGELNSEFKKIAFSLEENDNYPTYIYKLSIDVLQNYSQTKGVVSGYVPIEEARLYYESDCPQEYLYWEMSEPIPPEIFIELPDEEKKKYMKFYAIDEYSKEYVCSILLQILSDIYVPYDLKGEECILVQYSF